MSLRTGISRSSRARLIYALIALVSLIILGTLGFHLIEGWSILDSLYMTAMTVTTVGYGEPQEPSAAGRVFGIFFMLLSALTAAFALSSVVQTFVQSEIVAALSERRRSREMSKLTEHFIICGAGRMGSRILGEMRRANVPFVVIENDATKTAPLMEAGAHVISGDATLEETLREAGVERARGLAACLPDDADNLYVVLTARDLNKNLRIVSRAIEEQAELKLIRAGASRVVAPTIIGSHRMAQALIKPTVAEFIDSIVADDLDLGFEEVEISPSSQYADKLLRETNIRSELNIVVVAIRRATGEMIFNPSGEAQLSAGDMMVAIGRAESLSQMKAAARNSKDAVQRRAK
jgi:voltage-gated potassium channel